MGTVERSFICSVPHLQNPRLSSHVVVAVCVRIEFNGFQRHTFNGSITVIIGAIMFLLVPSSSTIFGENDKTLAKTSVSSSIGPPAKVVNFQLFKSQDLQKPSRMTVGTLRGSVD